MPPNNGDTYRDFQQRQLDELIRRKYPDFRRFLDMPQQIRDSLNDEKQRELQEIERYVEELLLLRDDEIELMWVDAMAEDMEKEKANAWKAKYGSPEEPKPYPHSGQTTWLSANAKRAADARHNKPGGSREKQRQIKAIWASGKYDTRDRCAEEECRSLNMAPSTARKALRNTPDPMPWPAKKK